MAQARAQQCRCFAETLHPHQVCTFPAQTRHHHPPPRSSRECPRVRSQRVAAPPQGLAVQRLLSSVRRPLRQLDRSGFKPKISYKIAASHPRTGAFDVLRSHTRRGCRSKLHPSFFCILNSFPVCFLNSLDRTHSQPGGVAN